MKAILAALALLMVLPGMGAQRIREQRATKSETELAGQAATTISRGISPETIAFEAKPTAAINYRINSAQSTFIAHVGTSGLLWFLGHSHRLAVRDFSGNAELTSGSIQAASLQMSIKTASLQETDTKFTEQEKQIITGEVKDQVLQANQYPEITFKSSEVSGKVAGAKYELRIGGDLTLHGVTRHVVIPAEVTTDDQHLRASGEFSIERNDYKVVAKPIKLGTIRAGNKITFTFNIVADRA